MLAVVSHDQSAFSRNFVSALKASRYFELAATPASEAEGKRLLDTGRVQFLLVIPPDFGRRLVRGERPAMLLAADATDPSASGNALAAVAGISRQVAARELAGPLANLAQGQPAFEVRVQRRYNPDGLSRYNIVPGLIGVILLKGNTLADILPELWPIGLFMLVAGAIAVYRYRETLD
ncbi:MAG: ABC transporter permease [Telluria sp.]